MSLGGSAGGSTEKNTSKTQTQETKTTDLTTSSQLKLQQEAIDKLIEDVLGAGGSGLASIFGGEQATGLFNTTTSAEQAGDLAAKIVGELAKLTGEQVTTKSGTEDVTGSQRTDEAKRAAEASITGNLGL